MPAPAPRNPMPAVAALAAIALALAVGGCSRISSPRQWVTTAELESGGTVTIAVRDESGRIDEAEVDPAGVVVLEPVSNPANQPNVLLVSWVGGVCDRRTDIGVTGDGQGLAITIRNVVASGPCDALGVGHTMRLTSSQPLPAAGVTVRTEPDSVG